MKVFINLFFLSIIFIFKINNLKADILFNSRELSLVTSLDYAKELTGAHPQATPYFAESALGSYPNLLASVGKLAPYAPDYQYFNSDYYYPTDSEQSNENI